MAAIAYDLIAVRPGRLLPILGVFAAAIVAGLGAALIMALAGHQITGMTNRVPWGLPHVFAYFLILSASGALNVAVIASVFRRADYKPLEPLSALIAVACLVGGLSLLVLDLGRPDRLMLTMTSANPRSIFAWNVVLYTGFMAVAVAHLITVIDRRFAWFGGITGHTANIWRFVLTTGTGLDLGVLVGRELIHSAVLAPLFISLALTYGLAVFLLALPGLAWLGGGTTDRALMQRLGRLLGLFVAVSAYLAVVLQAVHLYAPDGRDVVAFLLVEGGVYTALFWGGQIGLGTVVALVLAFGGRPIAAAAATVVGGFATVYVTLISAQVLPQAILPGMTVTSAFGDGALATYQPALVEWVFGVGGLAIAATVAIVACRLFRILPKASAGAGVRAIGG